MKWNKYEFNTVINMYNLTKNDVFYMFSQNIDYLTRKMINFSTKMSTRTRMQESELKFKELVLARDKVLEQVKLLEDEISRNEYKKSLDLEERRAKFSATFGRLMELKYPAINLSGSCTVDEVYHVADNVRDVRIKSGDDVREIEYRYEVDGKDHYVSSQTSIKDPKFNMVLKINDVFVDWQMFRPVQIILPALYYSLSLCTF